MKRDREVNPSKADQTYIYDTEFSHLLYSAETKEEPMKFNYNRVKNYLRKHKFNVFEYKRAIFPINFDQIHWVNIKAEFEKGGNGVSSIEVSNFDIVGYDSMNMIPVMKRWINFIEEYLLLEYNRKLQQQLQQLPYRQSPRMDPLFPQQDNNWDCGVMLLIGNNYIMLGRPLVFKHQD
jgi:Ulp1 family protease